MLGFMIDHLWQSTVFVALAAAAAYCLRRHAARWRYWIWFAASAKFLVPFAAITALGAQIAWFAAPSAGARDDWHAFARQVLEPGSTLFDGKSGEAQPSNVVPPAESTIDQSALERTDETAVPNAGQPATDDEAAASGRSWTLALALCVWLLGTCFVLLRWGSRWLQLRALARQSTRLDVSGLPAGAPELRSCPSIMEPGVFGVFRPVLLIPTGLVERLSAQQLAAIVQHERMHVERRDNLTASLHMLVEALFWFHPFVWWIGSRLVDERERACDEAVLAEGVVEPNHYAAGLIAICDFYVESPLLCAAGVGGGSLEERVKRIVDKMLPPPLGGFTRTALLAALAAALVVPLVVGLVGGSTVLGQPTSGSTTLAQAPAQRERVRLVLQANGAYSPVYEYTPIDVLPSNDPTSIAISPDGTRVAFVAHDEGRNRLWVQNLVTGELKVLPGTNEVVFPFWSPDGQHIGFFNNDVLARIEVATGSIQVLARNATWGAGGSWGPDGTILYGRHGARVILAVSADGSRLSGATTISLPGEFTHLQPHFLPDGKHFLYYAEGSADVRGIYVSDLTMVKCGGPRPFLLNNVLPVPGESPECAAGGAARQERRRLVDSETGAVYALGRLFFVQNGTLMAQPFDPVTLTLSGQAERVAEQIPVGRNGAALSAAGDHVVYRQGLEGSLQQLTWFDRAGKRLRTVGEPFRTAGGAPSLSPDGTRVVVNRAVEGLGKLFIVDVASGKAERLSNDPANNSYPIWSFDSQHVLFSSTRSGDFQIYRQIPSAGSEAENVFPFAFEWRHPMDWSRDGRFIVYRTNSADVWVHEVATSREYNVVSAPVRWPQISPDGRWVAYQADAAEGDSEIYIHGPLDPPQLGRRSEPIAIGGWVRWSAGGRELFYVAPDGSLMAVALSFAGDTVYTAPPERLFAVPMALGSLSRSLPQQYMVDATGSSFLVLESAPARSRIRRLGF